MYQKKPKICFVVDRVKGKNEAVSSAKTAIELNTGPLLPRQPIHKIMFPNSTAVKENALKSMLVP